MAKTIYKYGLAAAGETTIQMPGGAEVLCVQLQQGFPYIWARVDTAMPLSEITFVVLGTGHPADDAGQYLGTFQLDQGSLVFHVFRKA